MRAYDAPHIRLRDFNADIAQRAPKWQLVNAVRNPFYSEVGNDPLRTWSNFYIYAVGEPYCHPAVCAPAHRPAISGTALSSSPGEQNVRRLARCARRALFLAPTDMSIVTAAVAENPVLDATVLDFNTAERIAPLESTTRLPPQVALRFAQSESLAEFLPRPSENKNAGFDMIYVPTGQSSQLNDGILRRSFEGLEDLNVIIEKDAAADKLIHHLTLPFISLRLCRHYFHYKYHRRRRVGTGVDWLERK